MKKKRVVLRRKSGNAKGFLNSQDGTKVKRNGEMKWGNNPRFKSQRRVLVFLLKRKEGGAKRRTQREGIGCDHPV